MRNWQFPFHRQDSREPEALADIFRLKIRVFRQNFLLSYFTRQ
jgi:hypothetical protein